MPSFTIDDDEDDTEDAIELQGFYVRPDDQPTILVEMNELSSYFNAFDLLEAVIHKAYRIDEMRTAQILGEAVLGSVSNEHVPEHGWMGSNDG